MMLSVRSFQNVSILILIGVLMMMKMTYIKYLHLSVSHNRLPLVKVVSKEVIQLEILQVVYR